VTKFAFVRDGGRRKSNWFGQKMFFQSSSGIIHKTFQLPAFDPNAREKWHKREPRRAAILGVTDEVGPNLAAMCL